MLIDTHTHVIATDTNCYPLAPLYGRQSDWSAEHPLDYPDLVKANIAAGVDKAVRKRANPESSRIFHLISGFRVRAHSASSGRSRPSSRAMVARERA
jgi:hypothetical protein